MPAAARLLTDALNVALLSALPVFGAALSAGLLTALLLSWSKLDDAALRALPRAAAGWFALFLSAGFVSSELVAFASHAFGTLFELSR